MSPNTKIALYITGGILLVGGTIALAMYLNKNKSNVGSGGSGGSGGGGEIIPKPGRVLVPGKTLYSDNTRIKIKKFGPNGELFTSETVPAKTPIGTYQKNVPQGTILMWSSGFTPVQSAILANLRNGASNLDGELVAFTSEGYALAKSADLYTK